MNRFDSLHAGPLMAPAMAVAAALAVAADGRLLANALSDAGGNFVLQLPSGQKVSLAVDKSDGDVMKVAPGQTSRVLTTCLLDPSA